MQLWSRSGEVSLADAITAADVILSAISMKGVVNLVERLGLLPLPESAILVTATKGSDPATTRTPSQIFTIAFPSHAVAVPSGSNLSQEIAQGLPAATVLASTDVDAARTVQRLFSSEQFRVYTSEDLLGAELGGDIEECNGDRRWRMRWPKPGHKC